MTSSSCVLTEARARGSGISLRDDPDHTLRRDPIEGIGALGYRTCETLYVRGSISSQETTMLRDAETLRRIAADAGTDPRKWRTVEVTTDRAFLQRANASRFNWAVEIDADGQPRSSLREGPTLPADYRGKRNYTLTCGVRFGNGHLLGHRAGEFSSAGIEYATPYNTVTLVTCPDVVGLFRIKERLVAVCGGGGLLRRVLSSGGGGALIWFANERKSRIWFANGEKPRVEKIELLSMAPYAAAQNGESILLAGSSGITRVDEHFAVPVHRNSDDWRLLFPNSIAAAPDGKIYVGMRFAIAELTPSQDASEFSAVWRVPEALLTASSESEAQGSPDPGENVTTYWGE
jgi:hypothetical protein